MLRWNSLDEKTLRRKRYGGNINIFPIFITFSSRILSIYRWGCSNGWYSNRLYSITMEAGGTTIGSVVMYIVGTSMGVGGTAMESRYKAMKSSGTTKKVEGIAMKAECTTKKLEGIAMSLWVN